MDLIDKLNLSPDTILKVIDEYTLYSYYTEIKNLETRTSYLSPLRGEHRGSWSFFECNSNLYEFWWKDSGNGKDGNIFDLIINLYPDLKTYSDACLKIGQDFDIGFNYSLDFKRVLKIDRPKFKQASKIGIKSRPFNDKDLNFWRKLSVKEKQLQKYNVEVPEYIWYNTIYNKEELPEVVSEICFSYRIGKYYQIYKPFNKARKFRNDFPSNYVFGYIQLPETGDRLIIDKSFKDIIFCDVLNYNAISPKSENTLIPDFIMNNLLLRFKTVFIMLDNDEAGKNATEKYLQLYPTLIPIFLEEAKDKTDLCLLKGFDYTKHTLQTLL
jgi:hypothetical protein